MTIGNVAQHVGEPGLRVTRLSLGVAMSVEEPGESRPAFTRFLDDGRIRLSNNAVERPLCGCLGRRAWLFAGFDREASALQRSATGLNFP